MKKPFLGLILFFLVFSSCKKYSDGPSFSLLSKKERLCNDWVLSSHLLNDEDVTEDSLSIKMVIDKDGTYSISETYDAMGQLQGNYSNGKWAFGDSKDILFFYENGVENPTSTFKIKELRNKELKLLEEFTSIDVVHTYTYVKD